MIKRLVENRNSDLENGLQHDVTDVSSKAGLPFTVFVTSSVWDDLVNPDEEAQKKGESIDTRLDILINKLIQSIRTHRRNSKSNFFSFNVSLTSRGKSKDFVVLSYLGPKTTESNDPCITLLDPEEVDK